MAANEERWKVVVDQEVHTDKAKKGLDEVAQSSENVGDEFKKTGKKSDDLGDKLNALVKDAGNLDDQLTIFTRHRLELAKRLETEDDAQLKREYNRTSQRIGWINKLKKVIDEATPKKRKDVGSGLIPEGGGLISKAFGFGNGIGAAVIIPAAATLASAVGAAIEGALAGGVVAVGIAGGIASATKDARVRSAASDFGDSISAEFFGGESSKAFVQPTINALNILANDFKSLDLGGTFAKAAPSVETLAHGVGNFAKNLMPGFNKIMDKSGMITDALAAGFSDTGDALGDFLGDIADSKGTIDGINTLFDLLGGTIRALGTTLKFLGDTWHYTGVTMSELSGAAEDVLGWVPVLGDQIRKGNDYWEEMSGTGAAVTQTLERYKGATEKASGATEVAAGTVDAYAQRAAEAKRQTDELIKSFDAWLHVQFGVEEAQDKLANDVAALNKQLQEQKKHGDAGAGSLTGNTQAARDNRASVRGLVDDYKVLAEEYHKHGKSTEGLVKNLEDQLVALGFDRTEAHKYALALLEITNAIKAMPSQKTVTIQFKVKGAKYRTEGATADLLGLASGGPVMAGQTYVVGEKGPELFSPSTNGTIIPNGAGMGQPVAAGSSNATLSVAPGAGGDVERFIVWLIQKYVRGPGGGRAAALGIVR